MGVQNNLNESIKLLGLLLQSDKQQEMQREQLSFQANQQSIQNRQQQLMAAIQHAREEKRIAQERDFIIRSKLAELGQKPDISISPNIQEILEKFSGSLSEQAESAQKLAEDYENQYNKNLNLISAYSSGSRLGQNLSLEKMEKLVKSDNKIEFIKDYIGIPDTFSKGKEQDAFIQGVMSSVNENTVLNIMTKKENIEFMKEQIKKSIQERLESQFDMMKNSSELTKGIIGVIDSVSKDIISSLMLSNQYGGDAEQVKINAIQDENLRAKAQEEFNSKQEQLISDANAVGTRFAQETEYFSGKAEEYSKRISHYYIDIANKIGSNPEEFVREYVDIINEIDKEISKGKTIDEILKSKKSLDERAKIIALITNNALGVSTADKFESAKRAVKAYNVKEEYLENVKNNQLQSYDDVNNFRKSYIHALHQIYSEDLGDLDASKLTAFKFNEEQSDIQQVNNQESDDSYQKEKVLSYNEFINEGLKKQKQQKQSGLKYETSEESMSSDDINYAEKLYKLDYIYRYDHYRKAVELVEKLKRELFKDSTKLMDLKEINNLEQDYDAEAIHNLRERAFKRNIESYAIYKRKVELINNLIDKIKEYEKRTKAFGRVAELGNRLFNKKNENERRLMDSLLYLNNFQKALRKAEEDEHRKEVERIESMFGKHRL